MDKTDFNFRQSLYSYQKLHLSPGDVFRVSPFLFEDINRFELKVEMNSFLYQRIELTPLLIFK